MTAAPSNLGAQGPQEYSPGNSPGLAGRFAQTLVSFFPGLEKLKPKRPRYAKFITSLTGCFLFAEVLACSRASPLIVSHLTQAPCKGEQATGCPIFLRHFAQSTCRGHIGGFGLDLQAETRLNARTQVAEDPPLGEQHKRQSMTAPGMMTCKDWNFDTNCVTCAGTVYLTSACREEHDKYTCVKLQQYRRKKKEKE